MAVTLADMLTQQYGEGLTRRGSTVEARMSKSLAEQIAAKSMVEIRMDVDATGGRIQLCPGPLFIAAIDEALEAAARECEEVLRLNKIDGPYAIATAEDCINRIRALKSQPVPISGDPDKTGTKL